jgi:hypothetical protein
MPRLKCGQVSKERGMMETPVKPPEWSWTEALVFCGARCDQQGHAHGELPLRSFTGCPRDNVAYPDTLLVAGQDVQFL